MTENGIYMRHREGKTNGGWLLLDYRDIVVHIFSDEQRHYYALERIWSDAVRLQLI